MKNVKISEIKESLPLQHLMGDLFVFPIPEVMDLTAKRVDKLMLHIDEQPWRANQLKLSAGIKGHKTKPSE